MSSPLKRAIACPSISSETYIAHTRTPLDNPVVLILWQAILVVWDLPPLATSIPALVTLDICPPLIPVEIAPLYKAL